MADTKAIRVINQIPQGEQAEFSQVTKGTVELGWKGVTTSIVPVNTPVGPITGTFTVPIGTLATDIFLQKSNFTTGYCEYLGNLETRITVSGTTATLLVYATVIKDIPASTGANMTFNWAVIKAASIVDCVTRNEMVGVMKHLYKNVTMPNVDAGTTNITFTFTADEKAILTGKTVEFIGIILKNGTPGKVYANGGTYSGAAWSITLTYSLGGTNTLTFYSSANDNWGSYKICMDIQYH
jgi:hypothetical protein